MTLYPEPLIRETEAPPVLIDLREEGLFTVNTRFSNDGRIRRVIYDRLKDAQNRLPGGLRLVVYEAFRSRARQRELWADINDQIRREYPDAGEDEVFARCQNFVSPPDGVGSGHQFGCAVDVTLSKPDGAELDMGTGVQDFVPATATHFPGLSVEARRNRDILLAAMEGAGLVNYPAEWWHFSYGDRLWAQLTGMRETLFGPVD